jgi:hypothetical protein
LKSTGLVIGIGLWKTEGMKKPSLVIIKWQGRNPVVGTCSSCPQTRFSTEGKFGKPSEHERELRDLFNQHFRTVHMREDASQATARILKEATENL